MADIDDLRSFLATETGLVTITTIRRDGQPLSSVVNAGIVDHPTSAEEVVAVVARGNSARLAHLRRDERVNVLARRDWRWVAVEGTAELFGPDDEMAGLDHRADYVRLSREIFIAAGGTHDDWDEYDRVMAEDRRCCVFITPDRIYSNRGS